MKVIEIRDKQLRVQLLGKPEENERLVSLKQVRVLPTEIPASLARLSIDNIRCEAARVPTKLREHKMYGSLTMEEVVRKAQGQKEIVPPKKQVASRK